MFFFFLADLIDSIGTETFGLSDEVGGSDECRKIFPAYDVRGIFRASLFLLMKDIVDEVVAILDFFLSLTSAKELLVVCLCGRGIKLNWLRTTFFTSVGDIKSGESLKRLGDDFKTSELFSLEVLWDETARDSLKISLGPLFLRGLAECDLVDNF